MSFAASSTWGPKQISFTENMKNKLLLVFCAVKLPPTPPRDFHHRASWWLTWKWHQKKGRESQWFSANWVLSHFSRRIQSTHRPPLRSDLWWTLSKREGQRKENLVSLHRLSGKVPGQHSFSISQSFDQNLGKQIPPGTVSNSASSWVKVAKHGSCNMICSTRAWSKVKFLSLPRNWESCETETATQEWDGSLPTLLSAQAGGEQNNRTGVVEWKPRPWGRRLEQVVLKGRPWHYFALVSLFCWFACLLWKGDTETPKLLFFCSLCCIWRFKSCSETPYVQLHEGVSKWWNLEYLLSVTFTRLHSYHTRTRLKTHWAFFFFFFW